MKNSSFFKDSETIEFLDLESSFEFSCSGCGGCCRNNEGHILTGYDVYRIAKCLGISITEAIDRYLRWDFRKYDPIIPTVLMGKRENGTCSLFDSDSGECVVHARKPISCAILPLNMSFDYEDRTILYTLMGESKMPSGCGGGSKCQSLKDWIEKYAISENDPDILSWYITLLELMDDPLIETFRTSDVHSITGNKIAVARDTVRNLLEDALYREYNTDEPFRGQITAKMEKVFIEMKHIREKFGI